MTFRQLAFSLCTAILTFAFGCTHTRQASAKEWQLEPLRSVKGFQTPECAEVHPTDGTIYVSNIFAATPETIVALDANGFISELEPGGKVKNRKHIQGTPDHPLHGPSGMCFFNGYLYFNDRDGLKRRRLNGRGTLEMVPIPGADDLNDAGCDDQYVYVTSTKQGVIYRVDAKGNAETFQRLKGVNGIKCWKGRLFAATMDEEKSDMFELDPSGEEAPRAFGLAPKFAGIDGIEILPDGTFIVTDCLSHKIYSIAPDRKTVRLLAEGLEYPADLCVDFSQNLVYVPQFFKNTVEVYRLKARND